jgi:hypothetical protein
MVLRMTATGGRLGFSALLLMATVGCASAGSAPAGTAGSGSTPGSTAGAPAGHSGPPVSGAGDFCALLTLDEIGGFIGKPVHIGDVSTIADGCAWTTTDGAATVRAIRFLGPTCAGQKDGLKLQQTSVSVGDESFIGASVAGDERAGACFNTDLGTWYYTVLIVPQAAAPAPDTVMGLLKQFVDRAKPLQP